jgi:type 2A phosphatase activator TIP41
MFTFVRSQLDAVIATSPTLDPTMNMITVLGNVSSLLFYAYNALSSSTAELQNLPVNWVGFYLMNGAQTLALGPFQGRVACTKIKVGRGVCGGAALQGKTLVVRNVHEFPGHIACDGGSNSEVVVPIRASADNRVVGVLDIDSTNFEQFDEIDARFLEEVTAVIGERLEFPFRPPTRPIGQADAPATPPPTVHRTGVAALPKDKDLPVEVVPEVHNVGGWEFQFTQQSRIQSQSEQDDVMKTLGVHAIPEIMFPINAFRMVFRRGHPPIGLHVDAHSILQDAARYYQTDAYRALIKEDVQIPSSAAWKATPYATFDALVDWAWRHRYFGFDPVAAAGSQRLVEDEAALIDWDLLKRTDIPILLFASAPLLEDDLHDHGLALCTLKARVMETCFFVLVRHVIHVNGGGTSVRDLRIFHKFSDDGTTSTSFPDVVFEEQWRRSIVTGDPAFLHTQHDGEATHVLWSMETVDELTPSIPVVETKHYRLAPAVA